MTSSPSRALIGAALVFSIALFAFGRALVRAIDVDTGTPEPLPAFTPVEQGGEDEPGLTREALMLAVESDPFRPERTRAPERYRLPGEEEPAPPPAEPPLPPAPDFQLNGTVVFDGGGMALIELEDDARLVNVGEVVSGYRLSSVTSRGAVLENPFRSITLEVAGPQQRVAANADGDDDDDDDEGRRRRGRESDDRQETVQRRLMQQLIQRARQGGASPEQMEMIQRMMQSGGTPQELMRMYERAMRSGGDGTVEVAPERAIPREAAVPATPRRRVPPPNR